MKKWSFFDGLNNFKHAMANRYSQIIAAIFAEKYRRHATEVPFSREDIEETAANLKIKLPKNLGDVLYSFRYRNALPASIIETAPSGYEWIIRPAGRARYTLALVEKFAITPNDLLIETKIPDATPGIISKYALSDEQALLAIVRFNRLVDIFTRLTCYSLQSHLRTTVPDLGQVETDEVYIGIDKQGTHYVLPVQAKGKTDKIGLVQIEQDFALCVAKFPNLICESIAAQFMPNGAIALFELAESGEGVGIVSEKHYRLVHRTEITDAELDMYKAHSISGTSID